jgi:hypothetical protein
MLSDAQQLYVMHLAALVGVAALALRNQMYLRTVLLASIVLNIVDHLFITQGPNVNSLVWDIVALLINGWVLVQLVFDRTHIGLSAEEERLFQAWGSLSPGEFRKLLRLATWHSADDNPTLTLEGEVPDRLYYVLDGQIELRKDQRDLTFAAPAFIGEVAFVKERPASATVRLAPGGRYVAWPSTGLRRYFTKNQSMRVAVMRLLSADMAMKVARA